MILIAGDLSPLDKSTATSMKNEEYKTRALVFSVSLIYLLL